MPHCEIAQMRMKYEQIENEDFCQMPLLYRRRLEGLKSDWIYFNIPQKTNLFSASKKGILKEEKTKKKKEDGRCLCFIYPGYFILKSMVGLLVFIQLWQKG